MTTVSETIPSSGAQVQALSAISDRWLNRIALTLILLLAAALRFANLGALGYANHYYTAAIVSMLQSWHNFFFVAAEPGGAVSLDKPPLGFWVQTLSAYIFGVNGFGVILPEIVAGLLSILVLYHLVQRKFGAVAGLVAALALALTPIVVATDRNNTIDSLLTLTLLLAAWAFLKATESPRLRYLLFGALLVGIGFNIKMLQAYLPLPAFYALYFFGSAERVITKIGKLALASALLLFVSLSWSLAVDLTPADQRPYVGSSSDNSEVSLILGYNGVERLLGMGGRGGLLSGILGGNRAGVRDGNGRFPPPPIGGNQPSQGGPGGFGRGFGFGGGGFPGTGTPGVARLFVAPLSKEASWLLPFGIISAIVLALGSRWRYPLSPKHQALFLWGGWLLIGGIFFSIAGFFHEYYLSMLAPPLAALVGIGVVELWRLRENHAWLAIALLLIAAGTTLWLQSATASAIVGSAWWFPLLVMLVLIGGLLLVASSKIQTRGAATAGFVCILAALLFTPAIWSALTVLEASPNQTLPAAYSRGQSFGVPNQDGSAPIPRDVQVDRALLSYLESNTQDTKYLMAVPSSMQGADYIIATGRPVLYLGGFDGQDAVETPDSLAKLVADGDLRYIYLGGRGGFGRPSNLTSWVTSNCTQVQGYDRDAQTIGAPDGTGTPLNGNGFGGFGGERISLYKCGT